MAASWSSWSSCPPAFAVRGAIGSVTAVLALLSSSVTAKPQNGTKSSALPPSWRRPRVSCQM
jgi:hypothetical protein